MPPEMNFALQKSQKSDETFNKYISLDKKDEILIQSSYQNIPITRKNIEVAPKHQFINISNSQQEKSEVTNKRTTSDRVNRHIKKSFEPCAF